MMKKVVLLVLAIASISEGVDFDDCGSTATVYSITVPGCPAQPCTFRSGDTYFFEAVVGSNSYSNVIPFAVTANILGLEVTFISGDGCDFLHVGNCPIYDGKVFTARVYVTVPSGLPPISTAMRGILRDDNDNILVCAQIAIQLAN